MTVLLLGINLGASLAEVDAGCVVLQLGVVFVDGKGVVLVAQVVLQVVSRFAVESKN